jgi:hypothetical protein
MSSNNQFSWDPAAAGRKLWKDTTVTVGGPVISVSKTTPPHNPKTDAYRACKNCGKHINYHTNGNCPK